MRIHCFGCSWTFDIYENSWPQILANRYPQHQIYNYSMEATDPLYSLYCMSKIKKTKNDFFIFQGTGPGRATSFYEFTPSNFLQGQGNYKSMDSERLRKFCNLKRVTGGVCINARLKFQKEYFRFISDQTIDFQYEAYIKYAQGLADFTFTQWHEIDGLNCLVRDCFINLRQYKRYVCDGDGMHLGSEGLQKQVDWLTDKLDFLNVDK